MEISKQKPEPPSNQLPVGLMWKTMDGPRIPKGHSRLEVEAAAVAGDSSGIAEEHPPPRMPCIWVILGDLCLFFKVHTEAGVFLLP